VFSQQYLKIVVMPCKEYEQMESMQKMHWAQFTYRENAHLRVRNETAKEVAKQARARVHGDPETDALTR
jgi:hypothetical protein